MWIFDVLVRLMLPRWPLIGVAPALAYAGYSGWQVIALSILAVVLAELAFAVVRVVLLDREY